MSVISIIEAYLKNSIGMTFMLNINYARGIPIQVCKYTGISYIPTTY